jgi:uncharacterized membrane protein
MMKVSTEKSMIWPAVILASGALTLVMTMLDVNFFIRPALVIWFLTVCPGMAWIQVLNVREAALRWTLAITASLVLDLLLAMGMLYSSLWSPTWALVILVAIAGIGASTDWIVSQPGSDSTESTGR